MTAFLMLTLATAPAGSATGETFESRWQDGRAELDSYRLTVTRYGQPRVGRAVLIFVTEPFSRSRHVKVEDPTLRPADTFEALKLNLVRDFQTGVYDYHTMVSLFTSSRDFAPVKVAFSCAEWCGQVYEELVFDGGRVEQRLFSYFENQSATASFPVPAGGVLEDDLFILLRGLRSDFLAPGERRTVPFLASPFVRRLTHRPLAWSTATIERSRAPEAVRVPAGAFASDVYLVTTGDGRRARFDVERAAPHRVIRWAWSPAGGATARPGNPGEAMDTGELTGSDRLPYWKLNGPGGERYLAPLGLRPIR